MTLREAEEFLEVVDESLRLIADACTPLKLYVRKVLCYERSIDSDTRSNTGRGDVLMSFCLEKLYKGEIPRESAQRRLGDNPIALLLVLRFSPL